MLPYINIFGREIGLYAVCAILGVLTAAIFTIFRTRKYGIAFEDIILLTVFAGVFALVGAHLFYGVTQIPALMELFSKAEPLPFWDTVRQVVVCFSGMVYYGGFLGAALGVAVYTHFWLKFRRAILFDTFATAIPLFHVFGRFGCFFGGCCFGIESSFGFLMPYTEPTAAGEVARRFPVQLVEAFFNLALFIFLLVLSKRGKGTGKMLSLYLLLYPAARFLLEFLRGDVIRGVWFGLSTSQWISLVLILCAAISLLYSRKHTLRRGK